ncbi:Lar family restriction alleviation protein [Vibrio neptunius]|uniref:Lar family restriction alleviation protein n=1 Tax=Vibrio neptunius TaxID=170651 RepID=UPI0019D051FE|nr:Lar family restriction alleviation protein [Vibrio neptunius]MBN3574002.1 Lar family restriction alleviation protein [Vibrio neptunius]QXX09234.1 Lar family restriction alleviation protein [Vibrio neptunius]
MSLFIPTLRLHPCKACRSNDVFCEKALEQSERYFVICSDCGKTGPEGMTSQQAISLWNHPPQVTKPIRRYKDY